MPKGVEHRRNSKKKPAATLKEKRFRKREKRMRQEHPEHSIDQLLE